ncbi:MAG: hypothetical protein V1777_04795 [Candidatus Micrarchaeota archaeon]
MNRGYFRVRNSFGQLALEHLLVFAAFLGFLALLLGTGNELQSKMIQTGERITAIQNAKSCSQIIDSIFANAGGKPKTQLANCIPDPEQPHFIFANGFGIEKKAYILAEHVALVSFNGATVLEVTTPDHYR